VSITTDLDEIRARAMAAANSFCNIELDPHEVIALLDLVDELRRQVQVWKGKAE
jgi:hypothetical protein